MAKSRSKTDFASRPGGNPYRHIDPLLEEALELARARPSQTHVEQPTQLALLAEYRPAEITQQQVHASGNPYARIPNEEDVGDIETGVSIANFELGCRGIFRSYMPAWMREGPLHAHYREFIARNRAKSPAYRKRLLDLVRRYDLSEIPGLAPQFNRENHQITTEKLAELERHAAGEK
jgi:hypothetical protein